MKRSQDADAYTIKIGREFLPLLTCWLRIIISLI